LKSIGALLLSSLLGLSVGTATFAGETDKPKNMAVDSDKKTRTEVIQSMHGYVSTTAPQDEIAGCIDEALATAIERSIEAQKNNKQVNKYSKIALRAWKVTKCTVNYMLDDRGFLPSIEGGQLMLDENLKVHDKGSAECAKQMWLDRAHDKVVADVVEMITGFGASDPSKRQDLINDSMSSIKTYAGEDTAKHIHDRLSTWSDHESLQNATRDFPSDGTWTVKERQNKVDLIVSTISKSDPIIAEVTKRVHKYSKHSKFALRSSQVVETACNVASLTPSFVGPGAQAALLVFSVGTGGFEEDKLLAEMYLGKRFESRKTSFNHQALMAIDAYQLAMQTHNIPLASCSASLLKRLGGDDLWTAVCQNKPLSANGGNGSGAVTPAPKAGTSTSALPNQISESTQVRP